MLNLKNTAFKLWAYLSSNQNGHRFGLSAVECLRWGLKNDAYHKAVKELISQKFLVEDENEKNLFSFYEIPQYVIKEEMKQNGFM